MFCSILVLPGFVLLESKCCRRNGSDLKNNQKKYVLVTIVNGQKKVLARVAQHGDQLYEERGQNVQWAFGDGGNQYDRLEGLRTEFADWHAKVTLYKVIQPKLTKGICYFYDVNMNTKSKLTVNFLAFPPVNFFLKLGRVAATYTSYKIPYFCENLSKLI